MMLPNNLANGAQFWRLGEIRANLPNNFTSFFADNRHNVCFTGVPDNIIWMEPFVAFLIPMVWP